MGTTVSSIHVYSPNAISDFPDFHSFSEGWQTYMPNEEPEDPFSFRKLAKTLSRNVDGPVLWFFVFDSECIEFEFYRLGKRVAAYSQTNPDSSKNLYGIPAMVGYESGQKRRLSKILSCADVECQLELLEEYFGVCLTPMPDMLNEPADALRRKRGESQYKDFLAEEKMLTGKRAPIKAELVWQQTGKIFQFKFREETYRFVRPHHYYFGYDTPASDYQRGALRPVRFEQGKLVPITQEEFDSVERVLRFGAMEDMPIMVEWNPSYKIHFTEKAPEAFRNKTLAAPRGYCFSWFDEKGRAVLTEDRGGIAVVDESMKIIAKMRVKGQPIDYVDGYILTAGSESGWAYFYNSSDAIRIYRIYEN